MKLELYMKEGCPFCNRVIRLINNQGRSDVTLHDIEKSDKDLKRLVDEGGMQQVPCLFIDDKPMYESRDIIQFLMDNPA